VHWITLVSFGVLKIKEGLIIITAPPGTQNLGADPLQYVMQNLTCKGTLVGSMKDASIALDYAKRGLLKQICEVWPIDKLPEAVEKLRKSQVAGRIVIDFNA